MPAIQALAPSEPGAARVGENMLLPYLSAGSLPPGWQCCELRVLAARPDQVRAARQLVREHLAGHPAAGDAVAVASELAANSVRHSASRLPGGRFLVRVTALDGGLAAVSVTDQGGPFAPQAADPGGESGRGLAVVQSLSCLFRITDHDGLRSFTAVIAGPDTVTAVPGRPLAAAAARSAESARR